MLELFLCFEEEEKIEERLQQFVCKTNKQNALVTGKGMLCYRQQYDKNKLQGLTLLYSKNA